MRFSTLPLLKMLRETIEENLECTQKKLVAYRAVGYKFFCVHDKPLADGRAE